jgi:cytochrome c553
MLAPLGILTDADFRVLAVYYSRKQLIPEKSKHPETLALGLRIWRTGNPAKGLSACAGCHGPSGLGIPPRYPRLQGQFAGYLKNTLLAYQTGTLRNDITGAMPDIAQRMSTAEIAAVGDYAAGLR